TPEGSRACSATRSVSRIGPRPLVSDHRAHTHPIRDARSDDRGEESDAQVVEAGDAALRNDEAETDHQRRHYEPNQRNEIANLHRLPIPFTDVRSSHRDFSFSKASRMNSMTVFSATCSSIGCGAGSQWRCTAKSTRFSMTIRVAIARSGTA